jgi:L-asparaginase II
MHPFRVERTRGGIAESVHRVSAAVLDADGRLRAWVGNPDLITFWRSAAKPIQAIPLIEDGVLEHYGLGSEELALACASHSSEYTHLAVAERFLARIGCAEDDLACGPHPPLGAEAARDVSEKHTVQPPATRLRATPFRNGCSRPLPDGRASPGTRSCWRWTGARLCAMPSRFAGWRSPMPGSVCPPSRPLSQCGTQCCATRI